MYLAKRRIQGRNHYYIRESYPDGDVVRHRELCAIGTDPWEYIEYPGGNAYYIRESLCERLEENASDYDYDDLEDIFWPFVDPQISSRVGHFRCRYQRSTARKPLSSEEESQIHKAVHFFDKRRMHYLRCGRSSRVNMNCVPGKFFKNLPGKSRDELEYLFIGMESQLRAHEVKTYVYNVFEIEKWFRSVMARNAPEMLDQRDVDEYFLKEICRLNRSESFWAGGIQPKDALHKHLVRYVIMFFDHDFAQGRLLNDFAREFMNRYRRFHGYPSGSVNMDRISDIFGLSRDELKSISKNSLTRKFRKLARKHHPDQGGEQKKFVELTDAYRSLMRKRGF
jgi:hypothetical protein